jgi:GntR family transcriptional repressor for pyruvate dehydrogenase complex
MGIVPKKKLSDFVIDEIRRMILKGEICEGDKLPNQNAFSESLGVSRPILREALQTLSRLGAIEQRPGLGTVLVSRAPVLLASNLELPFMSDAQGTIELIETRRLFETGMIALVVIRASDEEIAEIGAVIEEMQEAVLQNNINRYQEQDLIFHSLIARAAHNRFVMHVFQAIRRSFEQFLKEAFSVMPDTMHRSMNDHQKIYTALLNRDQEQAVKAMNNHLMQVQNTIENYYKNREKVLEN